MVDSMSSGQGSFQEHGREQSFHLLERELSLCLSGGDGEVCFVRCQVCFILATFLLLNLLHFFFFLFSQIMFPVKCTNVPSASSRFWTLAPVVFIVCIRRASQLCFSGSAPTPVHPHLIRLSPSSVHLMRSDKKDHLACCSPFLPRESTGPIQCLE